MEHSCCSLSPVRKLRSHLPVRCLSCGFIFKPTATSCLAFCTKHQEHILELLIVFNVMMVEVVEICFLGRGDN